MNSSNKNSKGLKDNGLNDLGTKTLFAFGCLVTLWVIYRIIYFISSSPHCLGRFADSNINTVPAGVLNVLLLIILLASTLLPTLSLLKERHNDGYKMFVFGLLIVALIGTQVVFVFVAGSCL